MYQPDYERIAKKVVRSCSAVKEDETVTISSRADALSYAELIALECGKAGALPLTIAASDDYFYRVSKEVPIEYLEKTPLHTVKLIKASDLVISVGIERANPRRFQDIPEERMGAQRIGNKPLQDALFQTEGIRWVGTGYPTREQAEMYGVDFEEFFETYWRAMDVDYTDLRARVHRVAELFEGARRVHITSPKGTDLTLPIEGRPVDKDSGFIADSMGGKLLNLPAGEVCMAPLETRAQGTVVFDLAFPPYRGQRIEDLVVRFEGGKAIPVEAKVGFEAFTEILAHSHGDKDRIGELGIGLNDQVREAIGYVLTDEKIMGTVHIAIGENRMLGGVNDSDLHWDLLVMEPRVEVDSQLIMDGGTFLA
ncbi:MAG: aminopeptidase [Anaerolineae bacterium]